MGCGSSTNGTQTKPNSKRSGAPKGKSTAFSQINLLRNTKPFKESYEVVEVLHKGTKQKLMKVLHNPTNQYRACKQLYKSNLKFIDGAKAFYQEIEFLAEIDHPNIVKLYEFFEEEVCYYIIIELASGEEILHFIETIENFTERQAALIMEQIFSCLNYLHSREIVHQNILPENIILESKKIGDFNVKLVNFEKARMFNPQRYTKTLSDANNMETQNAKNANSKKQVQHQMSLDSNYEFTHGRLFFMAPEILKGKIEYKSDLWACGVLLYLLLCGYPPFYGESEDEIVDKITKAKFEFASEDWGSVSKEAKGLISQLLVADPKKRLSAAEAMQDPWIAKISSQREKENEKNTSLLKINHKIRKFSSQQKLEQAAIMFIVHNNSSNHTAKQLREIFKVIDKSGDGRLTYDELKNGYDKFFKNSNLTKAEFQEVVQNFDRDGSKFVEFEEFLAAFINTETILTEKNLEYAFNYFDEDKSGKLSISEIKRILGIVSGVSHGGEKIADALVDEIMKENDTNNDGQISFLEFKSLMKKILKD